jgi:hypothetical protein
VSKDVRERYNLRKEFSKSHNSVVSFTERAQSLELLRIPNHDPQPKNIYNKWRNAENVNEARRIYRQIYESVAYINSIYGLLMLLELTRNTIATISYTLQIIILLRSQIQFYKYSVNPTEIFVFLSTFWIVFLASRDVSITVYCHMATSEANKLQDNVQCLLLGQNIGTEALDQLRLFSAQILVNKIEFTAFGFFSVNLKTLSDIIVSVMTYIIVFEQMKE